MTVEEEQLEIFLMWLSIGHNHAIIQIANYISANVSKFGYLDAVALLEFMKTLEPDYEIIAKRRDECQGV